MREKGWTERLIQRLTFENEAREKAKKRVSRGIEWSIKWTVYIK